MASLNLPNGRIAQMIVLVDPVTGLPVSPIEGSNATPVSHGGTITAGGVSQTLMAANDERNGWDIRNNSAGTLWVEDIGTTAVGSQPSFPVLAGEYYIPPYLSRIAVKIYGATTGQSFTCREW